jgi:hypothetical protein
LTDLDDKISKFPISLEEDDFSKLDMMPPPLFSSNNLPAVYKYFLHLII